MKKIWLFITILLCKVLIFLLRLCGLKANNLPGNVSMKLYKNILLDMKMPETVIFITGTNGKTVSSNTLTHVFRENGKKVVNNMSGSNLNSGIISEFLKNCTLSGRLKADYAVLEVDEDAVCKLSKQLHPKYLIITNLYRDSISRNAHADFVYDKLKDVDEHITLILNADDCISGNLGKEGARKIYYGAEKAPNKTNLPENIICDIRVCPKCLMPITYDYIQFHHIGRCHCEHCGFTMPKPTVYASDINMEDLTFKLNVSTTNESHLFSFNTGNLFEIYNSLAITTLCIELGYSLEAINSSLNSISSAGGRYHETRVNDTDIISMVAKSQNPISCSQSFNRIRQIEGKKIIIIAINDREYGGKAHHEDTSWFYDTDFEFLISDEVINYIAVGPRAYDVALRLVLAGADEDKIMTYFKYDTDLVDLVDFNEVKGGTILYFYEVYFREWSKKMKEALASEGAKYEKK